MPTIMSHKQGRWEITRKHEPPISELTLVKAQLLGVVLYRGTWIGHEPIRLWTAERKGRFLRSDKLGDDIVCVVGCEDDILDAITNMQSYGLRWGE